ncbi:hypothetical protein BpHYR1_050243 [Brachionus plicatilis]|uniref:Uncharacterized protein n=1 Tax=Brachionus plicatilis TaxID=10195 RepID=A0A3M7RK89_BRAPC|nr:hypothetical protein BpHYR1_050243 [Brachionus plicatilis]
MQIMKFFHGAISCLKVTSLKSNIPRRFLLKEDKFLFFFIFINNNLAITGPLRSLINKNKNVSLLIYLFDTATLSNSSLFLKAYEFGDSLAALINSSAKHSAIVLMFLKAASRAPVHKSHKA